MATTTIMTIDEFVRAADGKMDITATKEGVLTFTASKFEVLKSIIGEKSLEPMEGAENTYTFKLREGKGKKVLVYIAKVQKQVHEAKDRDIKVWSGKTGEFGVKVIYHRQKSGEKQFRIFISYKSNGKLVRRRLVNDEVKKLESDEKGMVAYAKSLKADGIQSIKTA